MKATIKAINPVRGMVAAVTEDGECVVFEMLETYQPHLDDVVSHSDFHAMGSERYQNLTQEKSMSVFVQNVVATMEHARKQCFLT